MTRARSFNEKWAARQLQNALRERVALSRQSTAAATVVAACDGALKQLVGIGAALRAADLAAQLIPGVGSVVLQLRIARRQARRQAARGAAALARLLGVRRRGKAHR